MGQPHFKKKGNHQHNSFTFVEVLALFAETCANDWMDQLFEPLSFHWIVEHDAPQCGPIDSRGFAGFSAGRILLYRCTKAIEHGLAGLSASRAKASDPGQEWKAQGYQVASHAAFACGNAAREADARCMVVSV